MLLPNKVPIGASRGEQLARQRYFTIARDVTGDDDLTLLAEMRAYRSCRLGRSSTILDTCYPPGRRLARKEGIDPTFKALLLVFLRLRAASYPSQPSRVSLDVLPLPYDVAETVIPDVLDLRSLQAQEWFFETFYLQRNTLHIPILSPSIEGFPHLLPFLMTMELGGGGFTEGIGRYLRQHDVNALIYPSARNDSRAIQEARELKDSAGWCLVDYRGAERRDLPLWDLAEQTPFIFPPPTKVQISTPGTYAGSWCTEGIRQLYRYRYYKEVESAHGEKGSDEILTAMLSLEGGEVDFFRFATEYTQPLP